MQEAREELQRAQAAAVAERASYEETLAAVRSETAARDSALGQQLEVSALTGHVQTACS